MILRDWGVTEYQWRNRRGWVTLTVLDGMTPVIRWRLGRASRKNTVKIVCFPGTDNIMVPGEVLVCLTRYCQTRTEQK